jgi:site-specific recombinase XerD
MATSNYYLYDKNAKKQTLIILRFRYQTGNLIYSTRQKIDPKYWNASKKRAKESNSFPQHQSLNRFLNSLEAEVHNIHRDCILKDLSVSNEYLKQQLNKYLKIDSHEEKPPEKLKLDFYTLLDQFIEESISGIRRQKNGKAFRSRTIMAYKVLREHIRNFSKKKKFKIELKPINGLNKQQLDQLKDYWKNFYFQFTEYLYNDCGNFDNAVGTKIKNLRVFFNYLNEEKNLSIGSFHKMFYVTKETIPIIVLEPEQLNYLIYDEQLNDILCARLKRVKDIFVFGCTVALRVSDLLSLTRENLIKSNGDYFIKATSKKTNKNTTIKLPDYAKQIIDKYENQFPTLLPTISDVKFNKYLKELGSLCQWNEPIKKVRQQRGRDVEM